MEKYKENFVDRLISLSKNDTFEDCVVEWTCTRFYWSEVNKECLCGHPIHHIYEFENIFTHNTILVGSCCCKKFNFYGASQEDLVVQKRKYIESLKPKHPILKLWNSFLSDFKAGSSDEEYTNVIFDKITKFWQDDIIKNKDFCFLKDVFVTKKFKKISKFQMKHINELMTRVNKGLI